MTVLRRGLTIDILDGFSLWLGESIPVLPVRSNPSDHARRLNTMARTAI